MDAIAIASPVYRHPRWRRTVIGRYPHRVELECVGSGSVGSDDSRSGLNVLEATSRHGRRGRSDARRSPSHWTDQRRILRAACRAGHSDWPSSITPGLRCSRGCCLLHGTAAWLVNRPRSRRPGPGVWSSKEDEVQGDVFHCTREPRRRPPNGSKRPAETRNPGPVRRRLAGGTSLAREKDSCFSKQMTSRR